MRNVVRMSRSVETFLEKMKTANRKDFLAIVSLIELLEERGVSIKEIYPKSLKVFGKITKNGRIKKVYYLRVNSGNKHYRLFFEINNKGEFLLFDIKHIFHKKSAKINKKELSTIKKLFK